MLLLKAQGVHDDTAPTPRRLVSTACRWHRLVVAERDDELGLNCVSHLICRIHRNWGGEEEEGGSGGREGKRVEEGEGRRERRRWA